MINKFIHRKQAEFGALFAVCIGIVFLLEFYDVSAIGKKENAKTNYLNVPRTDTIVKKDTINPGTIVRNLKFKKVNVNSADINELMKLSGIGRTLARRIIKYRKKNGRFKNIDDLKKVNGLGEKNIKKIIKFIEF